MACIDFTDFQKLIVEFDQKVTIDKQKDKNLRYDVWKTTSEEVSALTDKLNISALPDSKQSARILLKLKSALKRIRESDATGGSIQKDIFDHPNNIEMSIALHEIMESVKGESDKARNLGIEVSSISDSGVLPALPKSRVAASIGRKIAFQKGYRFKRATDDESAVLIESLYYDIGNEALIQLEEAGYVKASATISTIQDYQSKADLKKDFPKTKQTRSDIVSVSLVEEKLGIKPVDPDADQATSKKQEAEKASADYFLNRTEADLTDTDLGVMTEKLRMVNLIVQPNTIVLPDPEPNQTAEELAQWDDGINSPDEKTAAARKAIYDKPLFVNKAIHTFMQLLNEETLKTGKSATQRVNEVFGTRKNMVKSLFGLKRSDDFSIDRKESISGQNLSRSTPLDDLVEYYDQLQVDGQPAPLHMQMKVGRNARLYYMNSVLNPHASKQSRVMLTPGEYTIDKGTGDFDYMVYQVAQSLKTKDINKDTVMPSYQDILSGTEITTALESYAKFQTANHMTTKMKALGPLARQFPGVDYATLLTSLQAIQDIRAPGNTVTTEFTVSADATASGGTLTFLQALGTNDNVTEFLQRIGLLNSEDTLVKRDIKDLYGLMSNAVEDFVAGKGDSFGPDIGGSDTAGLMQDTLNLLFNGMKDIREFSKDPTMVFVYGQGKESATENIAHSLANRIIDNLDDANTREYLSKLFKDDSYKQLEGAKLKNEKGLYADIVQTLRSSGLPQQMFDTMKENIKDKYLSEYTNRSQKVYEFMKLLPADLFFKVLPAAAVLAGLKPTKDNLELYGMPVTKKVEVVNELEGRDDTVLTRKEKLQKTVMDVSTTHGIDAALLYHSLDNVDPQSGTVVVHDDVRGDIKTVRAMEAAYLTTAIKAASEYDVHQQLMEAVAAYSPEIAQSADFKSLKSEIDSQVAEKGELISALFNRESDALIGDGTAFETFAQGSPAVDTETDTTVQSSIPTGPSAEQDFGDTTITIVEDGNTEEALAQVYWNDIHSRLDMIEKLKICLTK